MRTLHVIFQKLSLLCVTSVISEHGHADREFLHFLTNIRSDNHLQHETQKYTALQ